MKDEGLFVVISGCSGVGKGTVLSCLFEQMPELKYSVSATTRSPREGEVDGINYHFLTKDVFEQKLASGEFLEYVRLFNNCYGTLNAEIDRRVNEGEDVILEIDTEGALNVKAKRSDAVTIFIMPPSVVELRTRLENRGTETKEAIQLREAKMQEELSLCDKYDYFVVNDEVNRCASDIANIIKAERLKTKHNKNKLKLIRGEN